MKKTGADAGAPVTGVATTYVTPTDDGMLEVRFQRATQWFSQGKYDRAASGFDQIVQFEPEGRYASASLYNGALAHELLGNEQAALVRYRRLFETMPDASQVSMALIRASRIAGRAEDWKALADYGRWLVHRTDLTPVDRVEALGAYGMGLVQSGHLDRAAGQITKARALVEELRLDQVEPLSVGTAQVYFAWAELLRMSGEQIVFVPVPKDFADKLEERCQSLLDAQAAYATAMRAYDAHWSAMAGYRVGAMYQRLHHDMMQVPPPKAANTPQKVDLFRGAMHLRYRVLLDKGSKMFASTLAMVERTGHTSAWVQRVREASKQLEQARLETEQALAKLPFTEHQLQQALNDLTGQSVSE